MVPLEVTVGDGSVAQARWQRDTLDECHNDDTLWGYAIRSSEELRKTTPEELGDPVLWRLMQMGTFDWASPDHLDESSLCAIRYSSVMAAWLIGRILHLEQKVSGQPFSTWGRRLNCL